MTVNADKEYVLLVGTEMGKIKIYGLANNERKGILIPHNKVIGFIAWDGSAFLSAGSEGRLHVWLWKPAGSSTLGAAVVATGTGFGAPSGFGAMPGGIPGGMPGMPSGAPSGMPGGMPGGAFGGMPTNPTGMPGGGFGGM